MADKMANEIDENILKTKKRTVEKLISDIEEIIKDKLGNKNFSNEYPFVKVNGKINYDLPETLKKFGEKEERNWIFYGPPGTGKTFALNKISSSKLEYVINPDDCNAESPIVMFVKNNIKENDKAIDNYMKILPYCLYLFLANPFNKSGVNIVFKSYSHPPNGEGGSGPDRTFFLNKDLLNLAFRKDKFELDIFSTLNDDYTYYPNFEKNFDICDFLILINEDFVAKIRDDLIAVCNSIIDDLLSSIIDDLLSHVTKIVFHPSYTYEDFVGGIKPDLVQTKSNDQLPPTPPPHPPSGPSSPNSLTYKYTLGVMLDLIGKAWGNEGVRYYLIIDEFNRGNIAAIFGEFLYLIENDKRSEQKDSGDNYVFLPGGVYPWDDDNGKEVPPFSEKCKIRMPTNIFIVGALNTADRSIATMDFAMRRRFNFVKFEPNEELITGFTWKCEGESELKDVNINVKKLFLSLNRSIKYKLDADHEIGHHYFMPLDDAKTNTKNFLEDLFERKIIPLLEAYCDHDEKTVKIILELTNILMRAEPYLISLDNLKKLSAKQIKSDYWNGFKDSGKKNILELYGDLINLVNPNSETVAKEVETENGNK